MLNWCPHSFFLFDSDAFDFEHGTVVLRMNQGLDVSHIVEAEGLCVNFFKLCVLFYRNTCTRMATIMFI